MARASAYTTPLAPLLKSGDDEQSMQSLIRSTMMTTLQPVAEHVREVQEQLALLSKSVGVINEKSDENKMHLNQHQQDLQALRTSLAKSDSHVDRLQSDLTQTQREKERLYDDHEATKNDVAKVAANLRSSNTVLKSLQSKADDMDTDIGMLQSNAAQTAKQLTEQAEKSAQLQEFAMSLHAKDADLVRDLSDVAKFQSTTDSALRKFIHSCEQADAGVQNELGRLQDHLNSLETRLGGTQQQLLESIDALKLQDAAFRQMRSSLDLGDGKDRDSGRDHSTWRDNALASLADALSNLDRLDKAVGQLQNSTNAHKESSDSQFKDLESKVKTQANNHEKLTGGFNTHGEQIKKLEVHVGRLQRGLEAVGEQADLLHADQQGLRVAHNDAVNKQELHRIALAKTQADVQSAHKELHATSKHVHNLRDGLSDTNLNLSKVGGRYDTCTKSMLGLSKGLQDISRHVTQGEHGLLPPKSARRLPELSMGAPNFTSRPGSANQRRSP
jgi:chromosome segregation ATPase